MAAANVVMNTKRPSISGVSRRSSFAPPLISSSRFSRASRGASSVSLLPQVRHKRSSNSNSYREPVTEGPRRQGTAPLSASMDNETKSVEGLQQKQRGATGTEVVPMVPTVPSLSMQRAGSKKNGWMASARLGFLHIPQQSPTGKPLLQNLSSESMNEHPVVDGQVLRKHRPSISKTIREFELRLRKPWYIIAPDSFRLYRWNVLVFVLICYTAVITPYELAFLPINLPGFFYMDCFVSAVFLLDVAVHFCTSFYQVGRLVSQQHVFGMGAIARRYALRGGLWQDLVAALPLALAGWARPGWTYLKTVRFARVAGLARLLRLLKSGRTWERLKRAAPVRLTFAATALLRYLLLVLMVGHWLACLWGAVGVAAYLEEGGHMPERMWITPIVDNWGDQAGLGSRQGELCTGEAWAPVNFLFCYHFEMYTSSLYFSIMTITSIGYGNIVPTSLTEHWVCVLMMLLGASVWAYTIGNASSIIATMGSDLLDYNRLMDNLDSFIRDRSFPREVEKRLYAYFREYRPVAKAEANAEVLAHLSPSLRYDITKYGSQWLKRVKWLEAVSPELQTALVGAMTSHLYCPGEAMPHMNFFCKLSRGVGSRYGVVLVKGGTWGEDFILQSRLLMVKTRVNAVTYCEVALVGRESALELLAEFPEDWRRVRRWAVYIALKRALRLLAVCAQKMAHAAELPPEAQASVRQWATARDPAPLPAPLEVDARDICQGLKIQSEVSGGELVQFRQVVHRMINAERLVKAAKGGGGDGGDGENENETGRNPLRRSLLSNGARTARESQDVAPSTGVPQPRTERGGEGQSTRNTDLMDSLCSPTNRNQQASNNPNGMVAKPPAIIAAKLQRQASAKGGVLSARGCSLSPKGAKGGGILKPKNLRKVHTSSGGQVDVTEAAHTARRSARHFSYTRKEGPKGAEGVVEGGKGETEHGKPAAPVDQSPKPKPALALLPAAGHQPRHTSYSLSPVNEQHSRSPSPNFVGNQGFGETLEEQGQPEGVRSGPGLPAVEARHGAFDLSPSNRSLSSGGQGFDRSLSVMDTAGSGGGSSGGGGDVGAGEGAALQGLRAEVAALAEGVRELRELLLLQLRSGALPPGTGAALGGEGEGEGDEEPQSAEGQGGQSSRADVAEGPLQESARNTQVAIWQEDSQQELGGKSTQKTSVMPFTGRPHAGSIDAAIDQLQF